MSTDMNENTPKKIEMKLLKDDARVFYTFKKALEEKTGFDNLNNTDVIKWLIKNTDLGACE